MHGQESTESSSELRYLLNRHTPVCGLLSFISSVTRQKPRNMDKLKRKYDDISQQRSNCSTLTVLQWNVLADGLAQNGDFQRVSAFSFAILWSEIVRASAI